MAELTLRRGGVEDSEAVADVHLAARREAAMPTGVHPDDDVRQWLRGRIEGGDEVWVAETGDGVVGYARLTPGWLDDLYVVPGHARSGVGSALLDLVKHRHADGFCLWVFEMNAPARAFYRRHGLVELEHTDGAANEERSPDLRMAWPGADPLAFFRTLVDDVDAQLADLLARRAALTRAIQPYKASPGRDPEREQEIAAAMAARAPALGRQRLARILHTIISESLDAAGDGPGG
ncbi:GNAT family N-acetyltransferase [Nocardioides taihuensis]|uniref:GNAT family N-acetyltransferase n=1 Tax=Nocardioides taihuensis TaxID=1835606 RepID=A0ABW0BPK0_9ACTN